MATREEKVWGIIIVGVILSIVLTIAGLAVLKVFPALDDGPAHHPSSFPKQR